MFIHFLYITFLLTNTLLCFKKHLCQPVKHVRIRSHSFSQGIQTVKSHSTISQSLYVRNQHAMLANNPLKMIKATTKQECKRISFIDLLLKPHTHTVMYPRRTGYLNKLMHYLKSRHRIKYQADTLAIDTLDIYMTKYERLPNK